MTALLDDLRQGRFLGCIARLAPQAGRAQAQAELDKIAVDILSQRGLPDAQWRWIPHTAGAANEYANHPMQRQRLRRGAAPIAIAGVQHAGLTQHPRWRRK